MTQTQQDGESLRQTSRLCTNRQTRRGRSFLWTKRRLPITFDDAELEAAWAEGEDAMVEDGAHETADQPEDAKQQADQPAAPETETPPEQSAEEEMADQPQLFTLKYRGEQLQVTQDEMVALAQKGRDYDTVRQERDQLLQYRQEADPALELVRSYAQRNGMTVGDYLDYCRRRELMSQGINEQTANAQIAVEKQQAALQRQNAEAAAARRQQEAEADQARQRQEAQRRTLPPSWALTPA